MCSRGGGHGGGGGREGSREDNYPQQGIGSGHGLCSYAISMNAPFSPMAPSSPLSPRPPATGRDTYGWPWGTRKGGQGREARAGGARRAQLSFAEEPLEAHRQGRAGRAGRAGQQRQRLCLASLGRQGALGKQRNKNKLPSNRCEAVQFSAADGLAHCTGWPWREVEASAGGIPRFPRSPSGPTGPSLPSAPRAPTFPSRPLAPAHAAPPPKHSPLLPAAPFKTKAPATQAQADRCGRVLAQVWAGPGADVGGWLHTVRPGLAALSPLAVFAGLPGHTRRPLLPLLARPWRPCAAKSLSVCALIQSVSRALSRARPVRSGCTGAACSAECA